MLLREAHWKAIQKRNKRTLRKKEEDEQKELSTNNDDKQDENTQIAMESAPTLKVKENLQEITMETEQQMSLQTLLNELKDIKHTILNLDVKIDKELASRTMDYKQINETLTTQKAQIAMLDRENKELQDQNRTLQNELLDAQKEML